MTGAQLLFLVCAAAVLLLGAGGPARAQTPCPVREDEFFPNNFPSNPAAVLPALSLTSPPVVLNGLHLCAANPEGDWFEFAWSGASPGTVVDVRVEFSADMLDVEVVILEKNGPELARADHPVFSRERAMFTPVAGKSYHIVVVPASGAQAADHADYLLRVTVRPQFCDGYENDALDQFAQNRSATGPGRIGLGSYSSDPGTGYFDADLKVCFGQRISQGAMADNLDSFRVYSNALNGQPDEVVFQLQITDTPDGEPDDFNPTVVLSQRQINGGAEIMTSANDPPTTTELVSVNHVQTQTPPTTRDSFDVSVIPTYGKGTYSIRAISCHADAFGSISTPATAFNSGAPTDTIQYGSLCTGETDYIDINFVNDFVAGGYAFVNTFGYASRNAGGEESGTVKIWGAFSGTTLAASAYPLLCDAEKTRCSGMRIPYPAVAGDAVLRLRFQHTGPAEDRYGFNSFPQPTTYPACAPAGNQTVTVSSLSGAGSVSPNVRICPLDWQFYTLPLRNPSIPTDVRVQVLHADFDRQREINVRVLAGSNGALLATKFSYRTEASALGTFDGIGPDFVVPHSAFAGESELVIAVRSPQFRYMDVKLDTSEIRCSGDSFTTFAQAQEILNGAAAGTACAASVDPDYLKFSTPTTPHMMTVTVTGDDGLVLDLVNETGVVAGSHATYNGRSVSFVSPCGGGESHVRISSSSFANKNYVVEVAQRAFFADATGAAITSNWAGSSTFGACPVATTAAIQSTSSGQSTSAGQSTSSGTAAGSGTTGVAPSARSSSTEAQNDFVIPLIVAIVLVVCCCVVLAAVFIVVRKRNGDDSDKGDDVEMMDPSGASARSLEPAPAPIKPAHYGAMSPQDSLVGSPGYQPYDPASGVASPPAGGPTGTQKTAEYARSWEINYNEIEVFREVGRGSFGKVFQGRFRDQEVAIKILSTDDGRPLSDEALTEFDSEAELMSKLRPHQNVVLFLGTCTQPHLAIIQEFVTGGSLAEVVFNPQAHLDFHIQIYVARGIASGMLHLHRERIIHRDLACRNVLLMSDWTAKIADFGLSRVNSAEQDGMNVTKAAVGPLKYMAPEALAQRLYSEKSDVWSMGVTLWELFSRVPPFDDLEAQQVAIQVATGALVCPQLHAGQCPPAMWNIIAACFAFQAESRPDMQTLSHHITEAATSMGYAEAPPPRSTGGASLVASPAPSQPTAIPGAAALHGQRSSDGSAGGLGYGSMPEVPPAYQY